MGFKFLSMTHVNIRPVHVLWRKMVLEELRRRRLQRDTRQQILLTLCTESEGKKSGWVAGAGVAGESGMGGRGWFPAVLSPACPKVSFLEPQADL